MTSWEERIQTPQIDPQTSLLFQAWHFPGQRVCALAFRIMQESRPWLSQGFVQPKLTRKSYPRAAEVPVSAVFFLSAAPPATILPGHHWKLWFLPHLWDSSLATWDLCHSKVCRLTVTICVRASQPASCPKCWTGRRSWVEDRGAETQANLKLVAVEGDKDNYEVHADLDHFPVNLHILIPASDKTCCRMLCYSRAIDLWATLDSTSYKRLRAWISIVERHRSAWIHLTLRIGATLDEHGWPAIWSSTQPEAMVIMRPFRDGLASN